MRFMFGLITGAVLLLMLAGDPGGHLQATADRALPLIAERIAAARAGDEAADPVRVAQGRTPAPAQTPASASASAPELAQVPVASETAAPEVAASDLIQQEDGLFWPQEDSLPEAFDEDYAWWGDLLEASTVEGESVSESQVAGAAAPAPGAATDAVTEAVAETALATGSETPADASAENAALAQRQARIAVPEAMAAAQPLAPVWIPFHSEMSAVGFAQRLSRALEQPFAVRRDGPGKYQVVFEYADETDRDAVLVRVAALTGMQP